MKTPTLALTLALGAVLALPAPRVAEAGYTGLNKCRKADGSMLYTDKACTDFAATPEAMSNELGLRLASESRIEQAMAPADESIATAGAVVPAATGVAYGRRSAADGCARTPTQLAMDVQASIALHDVNRLAESYHWAGMKHDDAMRVMRRLEQVARQQVLGAAVSGGGGLGLDFADAGGSAVAGAAGYLQVSLQGDGGPRSLHMNVKPYAGCYFARF